MEGILDLEPIWWLVVLVGLVLLLLLVWYSHWRQVVYYEQLLLESIQDKLGARLLT